MSGKIGNLSPKQEAALREFRDNVKDVLKPSHDDEYLLRWLRARCFDLKKSEKMLRQNLEWRKEFGTDTILDWQPPEVLLKYYPGGYIGYSKEGYPIFIDTLGTVDLKGLFYSVKPIDVYRYKVHAMEYLYDHLLPQQTEKLGHRVDQCYLIFDMAGIGMKHLWKPAVDAFTTILAIMESRYPETLRICFVVNAPVIFPIAYNLAKPFLSEDTKLKIKVMGGNWRTDLLKYIDADQLPVHWGGTLTGPDGDKYCKDKVCMGGIVPEKYFAKNQINFVDMNNFITATVNRGSSLHVDTELTSAGCLLRWQFLTEGMDIGFGLYRKTAAGKQKASDMEVVLATERVNSHIIPEDGSYTCEKTGTYVLRFDNTYSYINAKKVSYLIEVLEPDSSLSANTYL